MWQTQLASKLGQCRAVPVRCGSGQTGGWSGYDGLLLAWSQCFDVDPWHEMFFFPNDTLHLTMLGLDGTIQWQRDMGPGLIPGMWFAPLMATDMDGDQVDELYTVENTSPQHPLSLRYLHLARLDINTGNTIELRPWPAGSQGQEISHAYRRFIMAGRAAGKKVLVTGEGTYGPMLLQGWTDSLQPLWTLHIPGNAPGARGSHMCAIADINHDGDDELFWGERCISLADGKELFCADREVYRGHSDVVLPVCLKNANSGISGWRLVTLRESDWQASPRVVVFDERGERIWGALEHGHMDMGWCGRIGPDGQHVVTAIRIAEKTCGPDGRFHTGVEEFAFLLTDGTPVDLPMSTYRTLPVDVNGDGRHELLAGQPSGDGKLLDHKGRLMADLGGPACIISKVLDLPGEQIVTYHDDGYVRLWHDDQAYDSPDALLRYAHRAYPTNQQLTATGSNLINLGGL
jgi:hypothetical protein